MMGYLKSKTMWFNAALAVLGVLEIHGALLQSALGPKYFGVMMVSVAAINAVLRAVTTKPLSEK